jgi:hypothetical protein
MLRICNRCALVALCLVTLVATGAARARSLVFITIDFPGAISTNAQGINAQGEIVGGYTDTGGRAHGFLRTRVRLSPAGSDQAATLSAAMCLKSRRPTYPHTGSC